MVSNAIYLALTKYVFTDSNFKTPANFVVGIVYIFAYRLWSDFVSKLSAVGRERAILLAAGMEKRAFANACDSNEQIHNIEYRNE